MKYEFDELSQSMAEPIVASTVAAPAATEEILYQPGIQFVPDWMKTQLPTSPETNE
jgi:hypothetical protein